MKSTTIKPVEYGELLPDQKEQRKARSVNKGKQALPFQVYRKRCEKKITDLQNRINAIPDRHDKLWLQLSKQKNSYEARLTARSKRNTLSETLQLTDQVMDLVAKEALAIVPKSLFHALSEAIEAQRSKQITSFSTFIDEESS